MITKLFQNRSKLGIRLAAFALAGMTVLTASSGAYADVRCRKVEGRYAEHIVPPPDCTSAYGLCIAGEYRGDVQGNFFGAVTSLTPTAVGEVQLFTSDSTIHARIGNKEGDLIIKNAGAFQTAGAGNIVDLQYIVGGTGQFAGASGALRASGTFDSATGMGESSYEGEVCLP
ncbi:MAG: hypothetical protein R3E79_37775 [Caldilineaceae bacterium]